MRGHSHDAFRAIKNFEWLAVAQSLQRVAQLARAGFSAHGYKFRMMLRDLLGGERYIRARRHGHHFESSRMRFKDVESLAANRASGTENGDALRRAHGDGIL